MSNIFSSYFDDDEKENKSPSQQAAEQVNNTKQQEDQQPSNIFSSYFDDAEKRGIRTPNPNPVQEPEPQKESVFNRVKGFVSNIFKKKDEDKPETVSTGNPFADAANNALAKSLEDKYTKLRLEKDKEDPRSKTITNLENDIREIEDAMSYPANARDSMSKKWVVADRYSRDRNIDNFKSAIAGFAKSTLDSIAQLYEVDFENRQNQADESEGLIRQGFKDLNIPEEEQQALLEKYSPRYQKDPFKPNQPTLAEQENRAKEAAEKGEEGFQKVLERYIEDTSPTNPDLGDKIVQGLGSMAAFYMTAVVTGGGSVLPSVLEAMSESGSVYDENRDNGMSPTEAFAGSSKTFIGNVIWNYALNKYSGIFEEIGEPAVKSIKKQIISTVKSGTGEGIQEAGQQLISNVNTNAEDAWQGVFESFGIGAIIGSGAKGVEITTKANGEIDLDATEKAIQDKKANVDAIPVQETTGEPAGANVGTVEEQQKEPEEDEFDKSLNEYLADRTVKLRRDPATIVRDEIGRFAPTVAVKENTTAQEQIQQVASEYSKSVPVSKLNLAGEDFQTAQGDVLTGEFKSYSKLPVLVELNSKGTYDIIDGNHRIAEQLLANKNLESVQVIENEALYRELATLEEGKTKYRVKDDVKTITGKEITDKQEADLIALNKEIFGDEDVKITLQIMANREALGSYRDNLIKIVEGQAKPKDTFYHEAVHKYIDVFTTRAEQSELFREGVQKYGTTDLAQVEENIAEDFIAYAKSREGIVGKIKGVFDKILSRVGKYLGNESKIDSLYNEILSPAETKKTAEQKEAKKTEPVKKKSEQKKSPPPPTPPSKSTQEPVGQGRKETSRLAERITEQLEDEQIDLPTYNRVNLEEQANKAATFLEENPEQAVAVSLGMIDPPQGQLRNPIAIATALKAREEGNFSLYTEILNSNSLQNTRLGQEIVSLRGNFNNNSPENYVKRIISNRYEQLGKKLVTGAEEAGRLLGKKPNYKAAVTKKIDQETAKLKEKVKKDQVKLRLAQDIIDAMRC